MVFHIAAAAFVSSSNAPLLVQALDEDSPTRPTSAAAAAVSEKNSLLYHILVHCSLDAVEERQRVRDAERQRASSSPWNGYLGLLSISDGYRMFGHLTNTNVKIILIVEDPIEENSIKEMEIQKILRNLHASYVSLVSNPFYQLGSPIKSGSFKKLVKKICTGP